MRFFGRKKEKEDFEEISDSEVLENKKFNRKLKDLNPENKKRRKEPPKPWGKKERLIVGLTLLVTCFYSAVLYMQSHGFKIPNLPLNNTSFLKLDTLFEEKVIKTEQKKVFDQNDTKAQKAVFFFEETVKDLPGHYGFLVVRIKDGTLYGADNSTRFQGASVIKLPLMILSYKLSEEGELSLETKHTLKTSDKVRGSGDLYSKPEGSVYTYRQLIELMGKKSDRTAYKIMKGVVGEGRLKNFVQELGMVGTDIYSGETTPDDTALILKALWDGKFFGEKSRLELLSTLENTIYEDWIPKGVKGKVKTYHKVGIDNGIVNDAGIVGGKNPYVLVLMGEEINSNDANKIYPLLSEKIYNLEELEQ